MAHQTHFWWYEHNFIYRTWNRDMLSDACAHLTTELHIPAGSPGGKEGYRVSLALGFFFKFFLTVQKELHMGEACTHLLSVLFLTFFYRIV